MFTSKTIPALKRAITSVTTITRSQKTRPSCSRASSVQTVPQHKPSTPFATPSTQASVELNSFPFPQVAPMPESAVRPPTARRTTFTLPVSPRDHAMARNNSDRGPQRPQLARFSTELPTMIECETEAFGLELEPEPLSPFRPTSEHKLTPYPREETGRESYF